MLVDTLINIHSNSLKKVFDPQECVGWSYAEQIIQSVNLKKLRSG
jgi:hypothetical protein